MPNALLDAGSQDCIFPWDLHIIIGARLRPDTTHVVRWRGTAYPLRFADVEFELRAGSITWRWPALVGFSSAPLPYPLLGFFGFLQFVDATYLGEQLAVELQTNRTFPGTKS